ncbi:MAG TPA: class I SAM-dependent methyltransferase [Actinomycetota bacterium]|nr:class I SAM-dependent methyltransferase [Actinomycetota bacterium]
MDQDRSPDRVFAGQVPAIYDDVLVPMIFGPYARDLAGRLRGRDSGSILEVAAGTGVLTRALAAMLPASVALVASDLNPDMIERAQVVGTARAVRWDQADVQSLPYADESFDAVVSQFGAMFFPDKARAFAEVHRVLRPGGEFLFSVWDRIETSEFALAVTEALAIQFPDDPPEFLRRTPHGYADPGVIRRHLEEAGFRGAMQVELVEEQSRAATAADVAIAFCQGTPLRAEIERQAPPGQAPQRLAEATAAARRAVEERFGATECVGRMSAWVVTACRAPGAL